MLSLLVKKAAAVGIAVLTASFHQGVGAAELVDHGTVFTIDDISYFIDTESPQDYLPDRLFPQVNKTTHGGLAPITIVDTHSTEFNATILDTAVDEYAILDDVFNKAFLQTVYVRPVSQCTTVNINITTGHDVSDIKLLDHSLKIPRGPYMLSLLTGAIFIPYRLYSDGQGAFSQGVVSASGGAYKPLRASLPGSNSITIAVPSRLYSTASAARPLAGVRIGVKDIYDVKGIKTGAGSRAYYDLYPEANVTAPAVKRLLDAGAIFVGKMKSTQFAAPENARDAIDYQTPFNPRGDGYQEAGSSSSGPGAGVASYGWLDLALGSDTGGSVRVPAEDNGLFGNRPTYGLVELTNVVPLAPQLDTAGLLARDPKLWSKACGVLYSNLTTNFTSYPRRVITYGLPEAGDADLTSADQMIINFVEKLGDFLSANTSVFDYEAEWKTSHPADTPENLQDFLAPTWAVLAAQEQTRLVRDGFFHDYALKYDGRIPFVNPSTNGSWAWGDSLPPLIDEAVFNKTVFKNWWDTNILPAHRETCSESIALYTFKEAIPAYRNTYDAPMGGVDSIGVLYGFGAGFISPLVGNPDFVIPLGQVTYQSSITRHEEVLPVPIRMMASPGCDAMLLKLINELASAGILPVVQPGNSLSGGKVYI